MQVTAAADHPSFETPNATMRTYASPAATGSGLAVWRAEMAPGAAGPVHAVTEEQVVVVLEGCAVVTAGAEEHAVQAGDSVVLPAGEERRIENREDRPLVTLTCARPGGQATRVGEEPVPLPWAR